MAASVAPADAAGLAGHFGGNIVVGARTGDGAGMAYTDFRVPPDGFARFLVCDHGFTPRQNQALLASMDRRAKLQLRLQRTVEGLSLAAMSTRHRAGGLRGQSGQGRRAGDQARPAMRLAIPVVALGVLLMLRRARRRLHGGDAERP